MDHERGVELRCESIPIFSGSDDPKNVIFFHRIPEQGTGIQHADLRNCSMHSNVVATVQCIDCVNNGMPIQYSYHCSNKCYQDAWMKHIMYHQYRNDNNIFNEDTKKLGKIKGYKSWPPADMVSWFDEKLIVVLPPGGEWVNRLGSLNGLIPFSDGVGFSFQLQSSSLYQPELSSCGKEIFVTDPIIQRLKLSPRSIVWLPDSAEQEKLEATTKVAIAENINILTYNILSDIYAYANKYPSCPQWALTWEYRRKNLLDEIMLYDADILCLQEVQSDHFKNFFKPELEKYGYSAVYKKRIREVYTGNGYTTDGCAIFFRNHLFRHIISYELEYSKTALSLMGKLDPIMRNQAGVRVIKDNVALVVILEMVDNAAENASPFSRLCVVNTHIYAGRGFPDVKLLQVSDLINEIEKIIDPRMPLFICGDLNSLPGSDPYVLLTKSMVNPNSTDTTDPLHIFERLKLQHSMRLASAYASAYLKAVNDSEGKTMITMDPKTHEPFFTSLNQSRGSTLDYIFYTEDSLEVKGILELPNLMSVATLPTPFWSSDHIALLGVFKITKPFIQWNNALRLQGANDGMS
ncbi:carbon catabolite repressor protein 4 homolog 1-like [Amaranthus tricolor]|uniref:carbon catabolite repressor protein 4 homolog 1-like n=1 Tax=Amaranthus tricolor TaxID=29722 RepID=UPI0025825FB3|nr:carbon catabolite repressor protein 4 homolog 1-like [Amaranthus tricolor]